MKTRNQLLEEALEAANNFINLLSSMSDSRLYAGYDIVYNEALAALSAVKEEPSDTITLPRELVEKTITQVRRVCDPQSGALLPDSLFIVKQLTTALSQQPTKPV